MQTSDATPPSKARGTRKMQQGVTKLDQDAYAWNIVLSGQQRTGEEFQGLTDRELRKVLF